jgi:hypothetical protein
MKNNADLILLALFAGLMIGWVLGVVMGINITF